MGQAKQRREAEPNKVTDIKIPLRKRLAGFRVAHHKRMEQTAEDGTVYAVNLFSVIGEDGSKMVEETPDGPRPVIIQSVAQPVRKSVAVIARI